MTGITVEQVHWAYRTFLNRAPESESAVSEHLSAPDLTHLARTFMESDEFRSTLVAPPPIVPLDAERNEVDVDVDADTMEVLVGHVRRCWELMGRREAYNSVLTAPEYLPDRFAANEAAFWASGEEEAASVLRILERHGIASVSRLTCVELGCGVGRVTAPLAGHFAAVHAYDISTPHLEIARTRSSRAQFHVLRAVPTTLAPADVFYSRIVLQHNPPPIIALLLRSAFDCLNPGGIAIFQVPTFEIGYSFRVREYLKRIKNGASGMEMHCLPQHQIFRIAADAGCRPLEVREDFSTGRVGRDVSNTFVIQRQ